MRYVRIEHPSGAEGMRSSGVREALRSEVGSGATIRLNRSERTYLALEGPAGSVAQHFVVRFGEAHDVASMRRAMRRIVSAYPRMRAVVERTILDHRLRVLPDDEAMDELFDASFHIVDHVATDLESLNEYANQILNLPLAVERGLLFRALYLPDADAPALILVVHHLVCDGRGATDLLHSLMKELNDEPTESVPIDPPTMWRALVPASILMRLSCLFRSFLWHRRESAALSRLRVIHSGPKGTPGFGTCRVRFHVLPFEGSTIRAAAKALGCSVSTLVMAALAQAFGRAHPEDGKNAIAIRLSVDLRRYYAEGERPRFGNYVATLLVRVTRWASLLPLTEGIQRQLDEGLSRFARHLMIYPLLLGDLMTRIGRKLYGMGALRAKRRGTLPPTTCHYSNLGSIDALNQHGNAASITTVLPFLPNFVPFVVTAGVGKGLCVTLTYPHLDFGDTEMNDVLVTFERILRSVIDETERRESPRLARA